MGNFDVFARSRAARSRFLSLGPVCNSAPRQHIGDISRLVGDISIFALGSTAFFGGADSVPVAVSVGVASGAVATMAVVVEEEKTDDVGGKTEASDNQHKLRVADFLGLDETLNGFKEDGETQGDEEDSVDQGS